MVYIKKIYINQHSNLESNCSFLFFQWFEKYPEFLENPFFISGESYAGIYVPTLSSEVVKGTFNFMNSCKIMFKDSSCKTPLSQVLKLA